MSFADLVAKELEQKLSERGLAFGGLQNGELQAIRLCERRLGTQRRLFVELVDVLVAMREIGNGGLVESISRSS